MYFISIMIYFLRLSYVSYTSDREKKNDLFCIFHLKSSKNFPKTLGNKQNRISSPLALIKGLVYRQPESKHCSTLRVEYGRNGSARAA